MTRLLVSVDIGGTLGRADGPSLADTLAARSPLGAAEARGILRQMLHTRPSITPAIVADLCEALRLPPDAFPGMVQPPPLKLMPGAIQALRFMSRLAKVVTLSNATCLEAGTDKLHEMLRPSVAAYFPSCQIGYAKPDPEAFRFVGRACRASIADMVHIGDDWACDIVGARSAGVTAIWISNGRPAPGPKRLQDRGVLVAADLAAVSRRIADLATWRRA
jgi:FMN phosphatase YigB (HAD superfamily)